jgi:hypothetical protein
MKCPECGNELVGVFFDRKCKKCNLNGEKVEKIWQERAEKAEAVIQLVFELIQSGINSSEFILDKNNKDLIIKLEKAKTVMQSIKSIVWKS